MRCKQARPFTATEINTMKTGAKMAKGPCDICGTTVCRILAIPKVPKTKAPEMESLSELLPPTGRKK